MYFVERNPVDMYLLGCFLIRLSATHPTVRGSAISESLSAGSSVAPVHGKRHKTLSCNLGIDAGIPGFASHATQLQICEESSVVPIGHIL